MDYLFKRTSLLFCATLYGAQRQADEVKQSFSMLSSARQDKLTMNCSFTMHTVNDNALSAAYHHRIWKGNMDKSCKTYVSIFIGDISKYIQMLPYPMMLVFLFCLSLKWVGQNKNVLVYMTIVCKN
jgi:hypothetical protein